MLLNRYERLVYSIPLRYGLSRDDAADIAQITFTILIQSMDSLSEDSRLGPWLVTVARRHTWRLLDRNRRERALGRCEHRRERRTPRSLRRHVLPALDLHAPRHPLQRPGAALREP